MPALPKRLYARYTGLRMSTKAPRSKTEPARTMTAFRCTVDQLRRMDENAEAYGLSRTAFILAATLGELPDARDATEKRFENIERAIEALQETVQRLSDFAYSG